MRIEFEGTNPIQCCDECLEIQLLINHRFDCDTYCVVVSRCELHPSPNFLFVHSNANNNNNTTTEYSLALSHSATAWDAEQYLWGKTKLFAPIMEESHMFGKSSIQILDTFFLLLLFLFWVNLCTLCLCDRYLYSVAVGVLRCCSAWHVSRVANRLDIISVGGDSVAYIHPPWLEPTTIIYF